MTLKIIAITLYSILIIGFGLFSMKKSKSFSDYFLGGGNVGAWASAFTYGTAYFSAVLFIGFAGKVGWSFGFSGMWIGIGNAIIGVLLVWWLLGEKIKKMSSELKVSTMAEYLEKRYDSRFLRLLSSLIIFIFFIPYSAAVFMGLSYLFESNFGTSYLVALIFMGFFTAFYMTLGGYKAMTMVDIFFGIIMLFGVFILIGFNLKSANGLNNIITNLNAIDGKLITLLDSPNPWALFCLIFLTSVAPFAMPQLVQKFYAIKDKSAIRRGMVVSTLFALIIGVIVYFIGSTTRLLLSPEGTPKAFSMEGKPLFDVMMPELFIKILPDSLSIILLLVILSASMSTLAALVLISSSSVVKDFYNGFINPLASDKRLTTLMRVMNVVFVVLSVILAWFKPDSIVSILGISWGGVGSFFIGPFVWGLYSQKMHKVGAIGSSLGGLLVCLILFYGMGLSSPEAGTIGMLTSFVLNPVLSLSFRRNN